MNPKQSETKFSIQINANQSDLELIQTEFSIRINPNHSDLGSIWIDSIRIWINPNESEPIQNKIFSPDQSESIRSTIDPNRIFNQNQTLDPFGLIQSEWIWINPERSYQSDLWLIQTEFSIRINSNHSELGSIRIDSIQMNPNPSETMFLIQINPIYDWQNSNFQSESIRIIPTLDLLGLILIGNLVWINASSGWFWLIWIENLVSDRFGFIRIEVSELIGLSVIDFQPFLIKRDTKRFSDWSGRIRIGSDIDIGMNRNSSDWLGMNFNSPGMA